MELLGELDGILFEGDEAIRLLLPGEEGPKGKVPFFTPGSELRKATRPRHVLLIEDDLDSVHSMAAILRLMGHHVDYAINGYVGMDVALRAKPEFIFLDLGLPGIDGFEVCRRLRKVPDLSTTRIIAITAYSQDSYRRRALEAGAEMVLVKPVDLPVIEALLNFRKRGNGNGNGEHA